MQGILETHYIQLYRPLFFFIFRKKWNDRKAVFQKQNMMDNEEQRMKGRRWVEEREGRQEKGEAVFHSGGNTI